jgi:hypothetical protein
MLLSILLVPSLVLAEDIYVAQKTAGIDNGSNCANAHSAIWFNTAGNWGAGVGKISGGDTAHLCGTITSQMVVQASGSVGSPITVLFESGAKISQNVCSGEGGCFNMSGKSHIILDGGGNGIIESTANGTAPTYANQLTSIGVSAFPCSNCEIKRLIIRNMYIHTTDLTDVTVDYSQVNAIKLAGSNTTVHHNTLHDAGWAIYQNYSNGDSGVQIHHNEIYHASHGWTVAGNGAVSASNFKFFNNHVYNYSNWDTTANAYHHDGIHAFGIGGAVGDQYDIYNNLFEGACGDHMTGQIFLEGNSSRWTSAGTVRIFNNVLLCDTSNSNFFVVAAGHADVYNNTVIGATSVSGICLSIHNITNATVKNNAISGCNQLLNINSVTTFANAATDLNYNTYVCGESSNCFNWEIVSPFTSSFANWKTNCRCDGNSTDNASLLLDKTGRPTAGSPVIGAGTNLSGLLISDLIRDKMLNARPSIGAWSVGAYHLASDAVRPAPPARITIQ